MSRYPIAAVIAATAILLAFTGTARAEEPVNTGYFGDVAIKGYDPVAYFTENKAVEGSPEFTYRWLGATWQFASAEHRDAFAREPEKYAPQFGGYCAWAVSHGYTAKGDPNAWKVVDDKLYLNYNQDVKTKWEQDVPGYISRGDENWPRFLKEKPEHKGE